jgi:hypothetical protein
LEIEGVERIGGALTMDFTKYEKIEETYDEDILDGLRNDLTVLRSTERRLQAELQDVQAKIKGVKSQQEKYRQNAADVAYDEFKSDALQEVGLNDHPKRDRIWDEAWDYGCAYGREEVFSKLKDLVDMFNNA